MALLYLVNFIDRVNVGFAALTMNIDLGFSPTIFGFGAGIFFIGYVLSQIPSNVVLARVGARRWIFCILATWSVFSAATAFVQGSTSFYVLRFFLGIAEAGLFPGMIFYLTLWFPKGYQARFIAGFALAVPIAGVIGGPLASIILQMDGLAELHGWQWLFLLEALPAFLLSFAVLKLMPDGPASVEWLTREERAFIASKLAREADVTDGDVWQALRDPRYWAIGFIGILTAQTNFGIALWLPQIVQGMGFSNFATGFIVALPYLASIGSMILVSRSSDANNERIWHCAVPMLVAACGFVAASATQNAFLELIGLTVAMMAYLGGAYGPFYSLLSSLGTGKTAAAGIALANSILIIGGFVGPTVIGIVKDRTGGYSAAMLLLAAALVAAALMLVAFGRAWGPRLVLGANAKVS
jgi:ACS family tartrate transporter-like MFS transporter